MEDLPKILFSVNLLLTIVFSLFAFSKKRGRIYTADRKLVAFFFLLLTLVSGGILWREKKSLRELEGIITIPEVAGVIVIPSQQEMERLATAMRIWTESLDRIGLQPRFYSVEDYRQLEREAREHPFTDLLWQITTPLSVEEIREFYHRKSNLQEWEIVADDGMTLQLKKDGFRLQIMYHTTWYPDKREIFYRLSMR